MFTSPRNLTKQERFDLVIAGAVSRDPDTGMLLYRSNGRRRAGRKTRYVFYGHHIIADSDEEAIDKANAILSRREKRASREES